MFWTAILYFLAYCCVFVPAPSHAIRVHDTFDGNFSTRHVLIKSGHLFDFSATSVVPGIMNGLPRGVFPGPADLPAVLMFLFGSLGGVAVAFLLVRLIGLWGMFLLCRDHAGIKRAEYGLLTLFSVAFACLPVFVIQGVTVTGVPFLLWAFLNLGKNIRKGISFVVIILFALWSQLILVGVHAILILSALTLFYAIKHRKIAWLQVIAIGLLVLVYVLANLPMISLHLFSHGYESSRASFQKEFGLNIKGVAGTFLLTLFTNDYSSAAYAGYVFIPVFLFAGLLIYRNKPQGTGFLYLLLSVLVICCLSVAFLDWKGVEVLYRKVPALNAFNLKRFANLIPALFFASLAILAVYLVRSWKWSAGLIIITQLLLLVMIWRGTISYNNSGFETTGRTICKEIETTFEQFFDPITYYSIKQELGRDTLKNIIHFGILSSASKYAGLNVLDDYQGDYPRSYKLQFRKIIEGELARSEDLRKYFDEWGSRCYLESAAHFSDKVAKRNGLPFEPHLAINTSQLLQMNCNNILSGIVIGNADSLNLRLRKTFVSPVSNKVYFLYRISS